MNHTEAVPTGMDTHMTMVAKVISPAPSRYISGTHTTTVGKEEANSSVTICPLALHVKISIWPGVSRMMLVSGGSRGFSHNEMT
jgi:hypothetical protein